MTDMTITSYPFGRQYNKKIVAACAWAVLLFLVQIPYSHGDIATDGTLTRGQATHLTGPDFIISPGIGRITGNNLFHSFHTFSIKEHESATFQGPDHISNIVSRVTGGKKSLINGRLSSEITGADFYFINPAGIMFGPNVQIDITGSLYAGTADYLKLGETGRFDATNPEQSLFTAASPSAFGFTSANPEGITIGSSGEGSNDHANMLLEVQEGKTISIIGGRIEMVNSSLFAQSGRINLVSAGSDGEVVLTDSGIEMNGFTKLNDIKMSRSIAPIERQESQNESTYGDLEAGGMDNGKIGGEIYIRGKNLSIQGQDEDTAIQISSSNFAEEAGGKIEMGAVRLIKNSKS